MKLISDEDISALRNVEHGKHVVGTNCPGCQENDRRIEIRARILSATYRTLLDPSASTADRLHMSNLFGLAFPEIAAEVAASYAPVGDVPSPTTPEDAP